MPFLFEPLLHSNKNNTPKITNKNNNLFFIENLFIKIKYLLKFYIFLSNKRYSIYYNFYYVKLIILFYFFNIFTNIVLLINNIYIIKINIKNINIFYFKFY